MLVHVLNDLHLGCNFQVRDFTSSSHWIHVQTVDYTQVLPLFQVDARSTQALENYVGFFDFVYLSRKLHPEIFNLLANDRLQDRDFPGHTLSSFCLALTMQEMTIVQDVTFSHLPFYILFYNILFTLLSSAYTTYFFSIVI